MFGHNSCDSTSKAGEVVTLFLHTQKAAKVTINFFGYIAAAESKTLSTGHGSKHLPAKDEEIRIETTAKDDDNHIN
ncbi:unnamed protein product [Linum trigynum]|uniref:Uncharacterized protein n=1 Tax=Linum trigynum TaxID=586398 RepID=A0AAV2FQ76_9ROSI